MTAPEMTTVPVTITGTSPLLCGRPVDVRSDRTPVQQARDRLYLGANQQPVMPALNLHRCLTGAGRLLDPPRHDLHQVLAITQHEIPIQNTEPWQVDTRMVRKLGTRERIPCHRPRFEHWSLTFDLEVDVARVPLLLIPSIVGLAGQSLGVGEYRAERGGPFGRFRLSAWGNA